jgi:hypothetical protein
MLNYPGFWQDRERESGQSAEEFWAVEPGKMVVRRTDLYTAAAPAGRVVGRRREDGHLGVVFVDRTTGFYAQDDLLTVASVRYPGPLFYLYQAVPPF